MADVAATVSRATGSERRWALALGVFGAVERLALALVYQPAAYGDTGSYMRLGGVLARLTLQGYDGTRTPGYPLLLALAGLQPGNVWLVQMVMGWAIAMLLFWITWRTTGSAWLSALVGGLYNLIPSLFLFEANLLSETLTAFCIVLSIALVVLMDRAARVWTSLAAALLAGIASSLAGLARPLFYFMPVWLLPFIWIAGVRSWRGRLAHVLAFGLPAVLLLGGWLSYIDRAYHMLAPTTMGGFSLVQHTGAFFEFLPQDVAPIRDTYLKYRDAQIAEKGNQTNAIWDAIPELTRVSGLSFYDLSREMQRLSLQLIREHPGLYLRSVAIGWVDFWKAPVYWQPDLLQPAWLRSVVGGWAQLGRVVSLAANGLFLLLSLASLAGRRVWRLMGVDRHWLVAVGLVWLTSVAQTLLDHGDNPRFLVPLQMVVIYVVARSIWHAGKIWAVSR